MIVVEDAYVATVSGPEHESGHVAIEGNRIASVGAGSAPGSDAATRIDASGCLVTPGLVNTHHHLYQWLTRGLVQDGTLFEWLTTLYPVWARIDADSVHAAAAANLGWLALSGCTTSTDHHYVFPRDGGDLLEAEITAATELGVRFHPARGSMDLGQSQGGLPPDEVVEDRDRILAETAAAIDRWHDPSPDAMTRIAVAPCSPFSVTGELMRDAAELARAKGVRLHTHLAETRDEEHYCRERFNRTPAEYVEDLGWLGDDVWLAHCVHLDDAAIKRFAATGTGVAHCPTSNGRLGAGSARVRELLDASVPVGMGVDGSASNEANRLVDELQAALMVARLRGGASALSAREALRVATLGGARCLGRDVELGSLERGKLADIAVWRVDGLGAAGGVDPVWTLAFGRPPLEYLIVNGEVIVERGELVRADARALAADAARASRKVLQPCAQTQTQVRGGIGTDAARPDGVHKVRGEFAYSSDLWLDDMLWGATLRSPHPRARIQGIDITEAIKLPGVHAILTADDVPGANRYGLEIADQPVLAEKEVRYQGEAIAVVAADHPEIARRAVQKIAVAYEVLAPVTDAVAAIEPGADQVQPDRGNVLRHVPVRRGDQNATADVVVHGEYEVGMQDQAFLGPESGLAVPADDGGVDLYIATQWLHADQRQVAAALALPDEKVRFTLAGVGGAFGGREDVSMQAHACLLALRTNRPVKMVYSREESFYGHVHRHPAVLRYEHGADKNGRLVYVRAEIILDGGAYASSSTAVAANAATLGMGPYEVPNVTMDCRVVYTNNPPCGAMRGFGAVQACFAYESQMDRLAEACGLDPVEVRVRNALHEGSTMPTGQVVDSAAPVAELLRRVQAAPMPAAVDASDVRNLPGGASNATHGESVRRGIGYAIGIKNVAFSEAFDDYAVARVRVERVNGELVATVQTAAAEVGQGLVTVIQQIVRTELGVEQVVLLPADTTIGSAGSTSASRQTYMTGGAVRAACEAVRARMEAGELPADETVTWRHRPTAELDEHGQGNAHVQYAFAAHRAVVDVDTELGLVKVVELTTAQDVGKAMNPQAVVGQIQGGTAQGLGLALMEEIQIVDGIVKNPSFTDYLLPTILDMPPMNVDVLELADPHAPYGLRGVGEPPTISSTPAIVAAIRDAAGVALRRVPVRPEHITGT